MEVGETGYTPASKPTEFVPSLHIKREIIFLYLVAVESVLLEYTHTKVEDLMAQVSFKKEWKQQITFRSVISLNKVLM